MKIRNGFVSNSSSSSFIVIGNKPITNVKLNENFVIGKYGECEFGWEFIKYDDMDSRINFAYLQARHKEEWMIMLYDVLRKYGAVNIECILSDDWNSGGRWAYIDHQSAACEGMNTEMFDNDESLEQFLFANNSYIQGGNDNV